MMIVRNRVNMRAVYFILSLLLISCSKDDASETPGKFELQSISIGEKQDQSSFENVAPSASIVLTFTDAVDEATIQSNIILKLNDQAVAYDSKLQGKEKLSLTPTGGFKSFSSYKLVINPGVKSTSGVSLTNGKVYEIRTGMDDSDKFDRIPDEDLLTLVQKQTFKYFWNFGHAHSGMACERTTSGDVVTTGGTGFGVMAMLVAAERGFVTRQEALERVQKIVTFLDKECTSYHGAYAHWINGATGETKPFGDKDDGADLVETSLLFQGLLAARYSTHNIGHYGLAFEYYTHFTSPIRRFPDMMVHRLLTKYLDGGRSVSATKYEDLCDHSSNMEQIAANAERASIKYKQVEFMTERLGQVFDGVISGVTEWGLYVELNENKCEGMIPIRDLGDDYYEFDEKNYCLRGRRKHRTYSLGDTITIKVARANLEKKQLDFALVE